MHRKNRAHQIYPSDEVSSFQSFVSLLQLLGLFVITSAASTAPDQSFVGHADLGRVEIGVTNQFQLNWTNKFDHPVEVRFSPVCSHVHVATPFLVVPALQAPQIPVSVIPDSAGPFVVGVFVEVGGEREHLFGITGVADSKTSEPVEGRFLWPTDVLQGEGPSAWTIIDTRSPEQFQEVHIPGSLNVPLYAVRTRAALKSRNVLLLGDGLGDKQLATAATELTKKGFPKVQVLQGGFAFWIQSGGQVSGNASYARTISAQEFWAAQGNLRWWAINTSMTSRDQTADLIGGENIPLTTDRSRFTELLIEKRAQGFDAVLLYSADSKDEESLRSFANGFQRPALPIFILRGGAFSFSSYSLFELQRHQRSTRTVASFDPVDLVRTIRSSNSSATGCGCKH